MELRDRYIELVKLGVLDLLGTTTGRAVPHPDGSVTMEEVPHEEAGERLVGRDWPSRGVTMVGKARLDNLQRCIERVLADGVPGDVLEAGVWRGGATIFARGVLEAHGVRDRRVWVADSFAGLPPSDEANYPADAGDTHHTFGFLAVPEDDVRANFARFGLLDDQVRFLKGFFKDTLPGLGAERWSVIRLDGDMYESTMQSLEALYPQLSVGGYVIIDDYGAVEGSRRAVHDYRDAHGIDDPIDEVDWTGVFWRKGAEVAAAPAHASAPDAADADAEERPGLLARAFGRRERG
jgi:O-methyltransferase